VQALVQGLETSVLYEFWMQAVTGAGRGQTTDVIRIITPSDSRPPGQPATLEYCNQRVYLCVCQHTHFKNHV